jgi:hypothetical protein
LNDAEKIKILKSKAAVALRDAANKFKEKEPEYEGDKFSILDHWRLHGYKDALYEIWKNYTRIYNLSVKDVRLTAQIYDKIIDTINYLAMLAGILALHADETKKKQ